MSIETLKLKVSCPKREWGNTTVHVVRYKDDEYDLIRPVNVCDQSNGSEECIECVSKIWNYFKEDPQRMRYTHLFQAPFSPSNPPKTEPNL